MSYKALEISNSLSNSLNQTLFNKYSDILQPLQIYQVGEYPYVKICLTGIIHYHNVYSFLTKKGDYVPQMTICVSFEILFLQHFLYGPYKAIIYSLKHLWNEKLKKKGKKECSLARDILFPTVVFISFP